MHGCCAHWACGRAPLCGRRGLEVQENSWWRSCSKEKGELPRKRSQREGAKSDLKERWFIPFVTVLRCQEHPLYTPLGGDMRFSVSMCHYICLGTVCVRESVCESVCTWISHRRNTRFKVPDKWSTMLWFYHCVVFSPLMNSEKYFYCSTLADQQVSFPFFCCCD